METIIIDKFGKDHWSLLGYCECRAVDNLGVLALQHLRIKNPAIGGSDFARHGLLKPDWKPEYGTRLSGYWKKDGTTDKSLLLTDHDDLDCLDDLEVAGLVKNVGTGLNPAIEITKKGAEVCSKLRIHKSNGGMFATFKLEN